MPALEVRRRGGQTETLELSPNAQVLVGQLQTADIVIADPGVQPIHCRFMLRKAGCEVTSVSEEGVECNGTRVRKAVLTHGDTIHLADVDIVLIHPDGPQPLDVAPQAVEEPANLENVFRPAPTARAPAPSPSTSSGILVSDPELEIIEQEVERREKAVQQKSSIEFENATFAEQLKQVVAKPKRPGEQDVLRSPLVMGLGIGTLALLLAAGTLWLIITRQSTAQQFSMAREAFDGGRYTEAIDAFDHFIAQNPGNARVPEAELFRSRARVDQLLATASPDWPKGLEALQKHLAEYRDRPEFDDPVANVREYVVATSTRIADGAAKTAGQLGRRPLLAVSVEGQKLVERFMPQEKARKVLIELDQTRTKAEAAVVKHETYEKTLAGIDTSLKGGKSLAALTQYKSLLVRYPDFASHRTLSARMKSALEHQQQSTKREEDGPVAVKDEPVRPPALSLLKRKRERSDRTSVGETVIAQVDGAYVGLDSVTGEPRFRRASGLIQSSFPLPVATSTPGWLLCDTQRRELLVINRRDGGLQWRLPLGSIPEGPPLVFEGQIYLALGSGDLLQIDLGSGKTQAQVRAPQGLVGPPVLSPSGERLYVAGNQGVLYVFTRSPLGCEKVVYLGHGPGAIVAPMVAMRHYLLIAENDRVDSCRLRLFKVVPEDQVPREIDSARVKGHVRDPALIYGRDLFVPSIPERIAAFSVSETDDNKSLVLTAEQQVQSGTPSRMFLATGPDGQLWMASTGLRRFQLTKDALLPDGPVIATGRAIQPLQATGDSLYVARRLPFSRAVFITEADRQRMIGEWQATTGASVIGTGAAADGTLLAVTSAGDVFRITADKLTTDGFDAQPLGSLNLGEEPAEPLSAAPLADGSLAVWSGGAEPKLFQVGGENAIRTLRLAEPLQSAPVQLGDGWLLPLAGKLRLAYRAGMKPPVQDLLVEIGQNEPPRWRGVAALDERHAAATTVDGRVSRVQWNEGDPQHLSEVSHWDAGKPIDVLPVATPAGVVVADTLPRLVLLDGDSLEPRHEVPLNSPALRLSASGSRVYVEQKDRLLGFEAANGKLNSVFQFPIPEALAGPPVVAGDRLLIALRSGRVLALSLVGKELANVSVEQSLGLGPIALPGLVVVTGVDGSVIRVPLE